MQVIYMQILNRVRMPIKKEVVQEKLIKIRRMIDRIEGMDFTEEQFDEDVDIQDLLVFRLEQAVGQAKELFEALAKAGVVFKETGEAMVRAVGFRNIAVHEYDDVKFDIKQVYRDYKDDVRDLKKFCAEVVGFLKKAGS